MKLRPVASLLLSLFAAAALADKTDMRKESLASSGRPRTYWLYVPEAKDASPRPLLLLLHGSTRTGETLVRPWRDLADREGIVLAGPDSPDSVHWITPTDGPAFLPLKSRAFPVEYTEMPGHDHNYYSVSKDLNRQVWDFLKGMRLPSDPRYTAYGETR